MPRPDLSLVPSFFHNYINQVSETDVVTALKNQTDGFISFLNSIPESKQDYSYGPGKWTIREMLLHIIDAERIFAYRALCIARKDATSFPSFEENEYAAHSKAANRNWRDLVEEFSHQRRSNELLFSGFDEEQLFTTGTVNGRSIQPHSIGFIMAGHIHHHVRILKERYGA